MPTLMVCAWAQTVPAANATIEAVAAMVLMKVRRDMEPPG
jgi:hypothetical protein